MRKEIIVPASGWIASGIVSIATWLIKTSSNLGLIYIGIFTIIVGLMLFVFNQRIGRIIDKYKNGKQS